MLGFRRLLAALLFVFMATAAGAQEPDVTPEPEPDKPAEAPAAPGETPPADAPPAEPLPPVYENQLLRLSELLGALAFLGPLCGESGSPAWQDEMQALLAAENPGPQRRSRLVGRFNHGFETFNAVYLSCTPSAKLAMSRYLAEGEKLSGEVRSRYSH